MGEIVTFWLVQNCAKIIANLGDEKPMLRRLVLRICITFHVFSRKKRINMTLRSMKVVWVWRTSAMSYPETTSLYFLISQKSFQLFLVFSEMNPSCSFPF